MTERKQTRTKVRTIRQLVKAGLVSDPDRRLQQAWQAIFGASPSSEDVEIAMSDLARYSGYYAVTDARETPEARAFSEGMRATYARIVFLLDMPEREVSEYRKSVLEEFGEQG